MIDSQDKGLFFVWKKYQRRPEVLSPLLDTRLIFISHLFKSKYLRPIDYFIKLWVSIKEIWVRRPQFIVAQCPPTYSALPAWLTGVPYIIDAHNPIFQVEMWQSIPLAQKLINSADAIIVHNSEMFALAKQKYPNARLFNISDPIDVITSKRNSPLKPRQILVIASFDPWDEPVELIISVIKNLTDYQFIVTADPGKLTTELRSTLETLENVTLTGFLPVDDYHDVLCSSIAALVLTTSEGTQPSGACEALSSDTQLIISRTSLTETLFGEWATLVENSEIEVETAIRSLSARKGDWSVYREKWNKTLQKECEKMTKFLNQYSK